MLRSPTTGRLSTFSLSRFCVYGLFVLIIITRVNQDVIEPPFFPFSSQVFLEHLLLALAIHQPPFTESPVLYKLLLYQKDSVPALFVLCKRVLE